MSVSRYEQWIISTKRHSTALSPDREHVYSFDLEGRPISWFRKDRVFKRGLDSRVHLRYDTRFSQREPDASTSRHRRITGTQAAAPPTRVRRILSSRQALLEFDDILRVVATFPLARAPEPERERLSRISRWTAKDLAKEKERFDAAYRPISILPPDEYLSIVLQATFGCTWNACTFCSFYQDRRFSIRPLASFREHVQKVRALLGAAASSRRRIFLADGNALTLSVGQLEAVFEAAHAVFPGCGISGFVDVFGGAKKSAAEWRALREMGLERLHIGIETGLDDLLRFVNKPGSAAESLAFIETIASAGIDLSLILMAGLGGRRFADAHLDATVDLISKIELGARDIIYISPFEDSALSTNTDSEYHRRAAAIESEPLSAAEKSAQAAALSERIRTIQPHPRIAPYEISEFYY